MLLLPRPVKFPATVAVFDCGTNTVLLLVARVKTDGKISPFRESLASPRLGEGLAGRGKLNRQAVARTLRALKKLKREAARLEPDTCLALGTNIFRRAGDGRLTARRFARELGVPFIILSAAEEARLEFLGATSGLKANYKVVVVDVGGGSSEIIWGKNGKIVEQTSLEIGAVRLKEKFPGLKYHDLIARQELRMAANKAASKLNLKPGFRTAILTGGTATALAAFSLGLKKYRGEKIHAFQTTPERIANQIEKFSGLPLADRKKALAFDPARADIIVPGSILLLEILKKLDIKKIIISDHGLRWGALHAYFS